MLRARGLCLCLAIAVGALGGIGKRAEADVPPVSLPRCPNVCVSVGDATLVEGDTGTRALSFAVTLSAPATVAVGVQYTLGAASATGGNNPTFDFNSKGGTAKTLSFVPSATTGLTPVSKTVTATVYADSIDESDESLRVVLTTPTGGLAIQRAVGIGTIIDDDSSTALEVAIGDSAVIEGHTGKGRTLAMPVTLSAIPGTDVIVSYTVVSATATYSVTAVPGADYGGKTAGTITFAAGAAARLKKLSIPIWADTATESHDAIVVTLAPVTLPPGAAITRATGTAVVVDDDPTAATDPVPNSMAALGDSITRAFDACPMFGECLPVSWATGTSADINSHYSRLLQVNPAIAGNAFNDAVSGARMSALLGQANQAVGQGVDYVLVLMGANDACTSSEAAMTSVATYQSQFTSAMSALSTGLPNARIMVVSVPDVWRLWEVGNDSAAARYAWSTFGICQSLLANPQSGAPADVDRRARVRQRVVDFNTVLANVCAQHAHCRFDNNIAHDFAFTIGDLSPIDYFHPIQATQSTLALGSYAAGFNW